MNNIITTLKSTPGATDMLTGKYKQKDGWTSMYPHRTPTGYSRLAEDQTGSQTALTCYMISLEWTSLWKELHHVSCGSCNISLLFICALITFVYVEDAMDISYKKINHSTLNFYEYHYIIIKDGKTGFYNCMHAIADILNLTCIYHDHASIMCHGDVCTAPTADQDGCS